MRRLLRLYHDAFQDLPAMTWWLSGIAFVNRSGTMVLPFLTLWATGQRGLDAATAGWMLALFGLGAVSGNAIGGILNDRIGPKPTMIGSMALAAIGFLVVARWTDPFAIGATMFAAGTAVEAFRPANAAALAGTCPVELHRRAFALHRLAINAGMAIGPTVGGLLASIDYDLLFAVNASACALTAVLVAPLGRHMPRHIDPATESAPAPGMSPLRDRRFLLFLVMTVLTGIAFLQSISTMPLYFHHHYGLDEAEIGLLFAINPVLIVLFEMVLVHALRRRPTLGVISLGAGFVALGIGIMPLGSSLPFAALTVAVWTFGEMLESPAVPAWISARAGPVRRGRYLGCYGVAFGIALIIAPIVGTNLYRSAGPDVLWLVCAAGAGMAALGYLRLHRTEAA